MENWLFIHFLSHLPGPLSFTAPLENNTIFLQQFFRFRGKLLPSPLRAPLLQNFSESDWPILTVSDARWRIMSQKPLTRGNCPGKMRLSPKGENFFVHSHKNLNFNRLLQPMPKTCQNSLFTVFLAKTRNNEQVGTIYAHF